jgi:hypothetical protein
VRATPRTRRAVAQAVTQLEVSRMLQRRVISEALKDRVPTVQSSQYKLFMNETGQRVANAALDLIGAEAQLKPGSRTRRSAAASSARTATRSSTRSAAARRRSRRTSSLGAGWVCRRAIEVHRER